MSHTGEWSHEEALAMLEHSYKVEQRNGQESSRLTFLADHLFDFMTYDDEMGELFAQQAVNVCAVITEGSNFVHIKDPENYRWYLLMVNMPFFSRRLEWGASIRGACWSHEDQTLQSCGFWRDDEQLTELTFDNAGWIAFIRAVVKFSKASEVVDSVQ